MTPASIRYRNPGAMWPGKIATKWGSTHWDTLNDAQKNKIALFPTFVQGASAQYDLWLTRYSNLPLDAAIHKWSGHNSSAAYAARLNRDVGIGLDEKLTPAFLASEKGWKFMKTQASWEAGQTYPMTDAEWQTAQHMVFRRRTNEKVSTVTKAGTASAGLGALLHQIWQNYLLPDIWVYGLTAVVVVSVGIYLWRKFRNVQSV